MKSPISRSRAARGRAGFSLVEVTLAVGIMAFSLVGILGVLPLAMDSGRQSFNQARASAVANTLFTSIREQPFSDVHFLDSQFDADGKPISGAGSTLNLNTYGAGAGGAAVGSGAQSTDYVKFYARYLDTPSDASPAGDTLGDQRRLCFTDQPPKEGSFYRVECYFNNTPEGTIVPATAPRVGQANRVTAVVSASSLAEEARQASSKTAPRESYRFVTTIANRWN